MEQSLNFTIFMVNNRATIPSHAVRSLFDQVTHLARAVWRLKHGNRNTLTNERQKSKRRLCLAKKSNKPRDTPSKKQGEAKLAADYIDLLESYAHPVAEAVYKRAVAQGNISFIKDEQARHL